MNEEQERALLGLIAKAEHAAAVLAAVPGGDELRVALHHAIQRVRRAFAASSSGGQR